jgi:hypothetical protein
MKSVNLKLHIPFTIVLTVAALCSTTQAQQYLNTDRQKLRQQLIYFYADYRYKSIMQETDSSIVVQIRDSTVLPFDFITYFNQADICNALKNLYYCDSCMRQSVAYIVNSKKNGWQKITDNFYISKFAKKMALTIDTAAGSYSYTTTAMDWSREEYKTAQQAASPAQWMQQYKLQPPEQYQPDTANVIIWSAKRLDWADFKEEVFNDIYPGAKAKIHWNYRHSFGSIYKDGGKTKVTVQVYALCVPARSWVRPVNIGKKEVLVHEQLHFDIVELFARQLRQLLTQTPFNRDNYKKAITKAFNKSNTLMQQMQKEYDDGVKDDYSNARLAAWLALVADKITALDKYKSTSVAVTLYE